MPMLAAGAWLRWTSAGDEARVRTSAVVKLQIVGMHFRRGVGVGGALTPCLRR